MTSRAKKKKFVLGTMLKYLKKDDVNSSTNIPKTTNDCLLLYIERDFSRWY